MDDRELRAEVGLQRDRQAIVDCLLRYTRGVDRNDEELIRSAYHEDAEDFREPGPAQTVDGFLADWLPRQVTRDRTQHYVTNQAIEIDGDTAQVETYFVAVLREKGEDDGATVGGRYLDRLERRDGDWRIAKRIVVGEWRTRFDYSATPASYGGWARRDRTDLVYTRPLADPPPQKART